MAPEVVAEPAPDPMQEQADAALALLDQLMAMTDAQLKDVLEEAGGKDIATLKRAAKELDPELFDRVVYLLGELSNPGPHYPEDYPPTFTKPKKPTKEQMTGAANQDEGAYRDYRERVRTVREWLMMQRRGRFKYENAKQRKEEYRSPQLHNEWQMRAQIIGSAECDITMPVVHPQVRKEAQQVEDFCYWAWDRVREQHADMLNGPIEIDEAKYADSTGIIVYRCDMFPMEPRFPWIVELLDPTTVFPVPGGPQGLLRVTRKYHTALGRAIDSFDLKGNLARKLLGKPNTQGELPLLTDDVEVIEYDDRWWRAVFVGGEQAYMIEHKYGYVPYVIQVNGYGLPLGSVGVQGQSGINGSNSSDVVNWQHWASGSLDKQIVAHGQMEALINEDFTTVRRMGNPAWFRKYALQAANQKNRAVELEDGAVNPHLDAEEFNPIAIGPPPQYLQPVMADLQKAEATGMLPPVSYGLAGGSNVSGNALSGLDEAGRDKLFATIRTCELARQRLFRMMLRQMADWGDILGEEGKRGRIVVPYGPHRRDTNAVAFELTSDTVKATGVEIQVKLRDDPLDTLLPRVNAANLAIQAGIMSRRSGIDLLRYRDPQAMLDEIIEENALMDDRMRDMYVLKVLLDQAGASNDLPPDFWAKQWMKAMDTSSQGNGGPPPPAGPPGPPPTAGPTVNGGGGGVPMNPGVNTSAVNMQSLGQGQVGPTGRPPLPPGGFPPGGIGA